MWQGDANASLFEACRFGNVHQVAIMVEAGADIIAVDGVSDICMCSPVCISLCFVCLYERVFIFPYGHVLWIF
jgi:hypothetical protein